MNDNIDYNKLFDPPKHILHGVFSNWNLVTSPNEYKSIIPILPYAQLAQCYPLYDRLRYTKVKDNNFYKLLSAALSLGNSELKCATLMSMTYTSYNMSKFEDVYDNYRKPDTTQTAKPVCDTITEISRLTTQQRSILWCNSKPSTVIKILNNPGTDIYETILDVVDPRLRRTVMAREFLAWYNQFWLSDMCKMYSSGGIWCTAHNSILELRKLIAYKELHNEDQVHETLPNELITLSETTEQQTQQDDIVILTIDENGHTEEQRTRFTAVTEDDDDNDDETYRDDLGGYIEVVEITDTNTTT